MWKDLVVEKDHDPDALKKQRARVRKQLETAHARGAVRVTVRSIEWRCEDAALHMCYRFTRTCHENF
jgi:hypothetical protein